MARIRTVRPELWESEKLGRLSVLARLTFVGLISLADDEGRGRGDALFLRGRLHPYALDVEPKAITKALDDLAETGLVTLYQHDNCSYYALPGWAEHQKIDRPRMSSLPAPLEKATIQRGFDERSTNDRRAFGEGSLLDKEWNGREGIQIAPSPAAAEAAEPAVLTFPCVGNGSQTWPLTAKKVREYEEAYPGIEVTSECRKALQWLRDNPSKRKTEKGLPAFLNRWLSKAQNGVSASKKNISGDHGESIDAMIRATEADAARRAAL